MVLTAANEQKVKDFVRVTTRGGAARVLVRGGRVAEGR
jgi:hypothetical protein